MADYLFDCCVQNISTHKIEKLNQVFLLEINSDPKLCRNLLSSSDGDITAFVRTHVYNIFYYFQKQDKFYLYFVDGQRMLFDPKVDTIIFSSLVCDHLKSRGLDFSLGNSKSQIETPDLLEGL